VQQLDSSFRDPSGFVFLHEGRIRRWVSTEYGSTYDRLIASGLYDELKRERLLVSHIELSDAQEIGLPAHRVIEPELVPHISYPYEWSFTQLKDAALLTLEVQERALDRQMTLKDASAFNVQFMRCAPLLIDTLSFDQYREGEPWSAYRQFCQHFVAPLALMCKVDIRLGALFKHYLDGIPIDLGDRLLPARSKIRPGLLIHVHLHARSLRRHAATALKSLKKPPRVSRTALLGLVASLRAVVEGFEWEPAGTEWADYEDTHNYTSQADRAKRELVREFLLMLDAPGRAIWDLGANTGAYSRIAADLGASVISFDIDPAAVDRHYRSLRSTGESRILPLLMDLTNPSPAVGWKNSERSAWNARGRPDILLALALVHHLAIGNNVPLPSIAEAFSELADDLVIEFVPKSDGQVQRMLGSRPDIFPDYHQAGFEGAFQLQYEIVRAGQLEGSERTIYCMRRRCN
jgi:hypothetical protein